mgnify:CR=1 FL=1|jgi:hypothetical protein
MILKSQKNQVEAFLVESNEGLVWHEYNAVPVDIEDIFCPVNQRQSLSGYKYLFDVISSDKSMKTPIILIRNTQTNYDMAIRQVRKDFVVPRNENKDLLAYNGNQRIQIAKELGYIAISSMLVESVQWAYTVHLVLDEGRITNNEV